MILITEWNLNLCCLKFLSFPEARVSNLKLYTESQAQQVSFHAFLKFIFRDFEHWVSQIAFINVLPSVVMTLQLFRPKFCLTSKLRSVATSLISECNYLSLSYRLALVLNCRLANRPLEAASEMNNFLFVWLWTNQILWNLNTVGLRLAKVNKKVVGSISWLGQFIQTPRDEPISTDKQIPIQRLYLHLCGWLSASLCHFM